MNEVLSLKEAAERVGVTPATLRRWAQSGLIPEVDGSGVWTRAAVAHARIVARLRQRGHTPEHIREAGRQGRLAYGCVEDIFSPPERVTSLREASSETGVDEKLIERCWMSLVRGSGRSAQRPTALYRDGDYYGREVNLASRIVARARGGEVLVSDTVVDAVRDAPELGFEGIGQVKFKRFDEPRRLCRATLREGS